MKSMLALYSDLLQVMETYKVEVNFWWLRSLKNNINLNVIINVCLSILSAVAVDLVFLALSPILCIRDLLLAKLSSRQQQGLRPTSTRARSYNDADSHDGTVSLAEGYLESAVSVMPVALLHISVMTVLLVTNLTVLLAVVVITIVEIVVVQARQQYQHIKSRLSSRDRQST